jgi:hypothetical protein
MEPKFKKITKMKTEPKLKMEQIKNGTKNKKTRPLSRL